MVGQPSPGVPVYTVKGAKVLHRNLLLPLQGTVREQGGIKGEDISGSEDEEEGGDEISKVTRAPQGRPRRSTKPKVSTTQQKEASGKDASADLESAASVSRLLSKQKNYSLLGVPSSPWPLSGDEDSSEEESTQTSGHLTPQLVVPQLLTS